MISLLNFVQACKKIHASKKKLCNFKGFIKTWLTELKEMLKICIFLQ